jgi:hypothetical protein
MRLLSGFGWKRGPSAGNCPAAGSGGAGWLQRSFDSHTLRRNYIFGIELEEPRLAFSQPFVIRMRYFTKKNVSEGQKC